jgi:hypothetical protein
MGAVSLTVEDGISPVLEKLIRKTRDLTPAMKEVELLVMRPLKYKAWRESGLTSRSGELEDSVQTWHGKKSAGISVKTLPGKDLVIPKAVTQMSGRKSGSATRKRHYRVRKYNRGAVAVGSYTRTSSGSPWGDIPARPFIPQVFSAMDVRRISSIIEDFFKDVQDV